ncbi:hypothetical protein Tcan_06960 [Toxocara canis]|uniref:Uncharacterized protein n=1 Tax=Toxocara canis TaxID=6265 RepID=A0A0B2UWS9_TOXCA|nr:hypothetical protein Tcan_06960 [Toxocara canis]
MSGTEMAITASEVSDFAYVTLVASSLSLFPTLFLCSRRKRTVASNRPKLAKIMAHKPEKVVVEQTTRMSLRSEETVENCSSISAYGVDTTHKKSPDTTKSKRSPISTHSRRRKSQRKLFRKRASSKRHQSEPSTRPIRLKPSESTSIKMNNERNTTDIKAKTSQTISERAIYEERV